MSRQSEFASVGKTLPSSVGCDGKVAFDSFKLANAVVKRHGTDDARRCRTAYRCGHCGKWHVGNNKGQSQRKEAASLRQRKHDE